MWFLDKEKIFLIMKKVAVIILNYDSQKDILECISSIRKSTYSDFSIIVVDNSLSDVLKDDLPKLKEIIYLPNYRNLGYAEGNNIGIKYALAGGADYVFILNPDTTVDKNCIEECIKGIQLGADIIGPKILFDDKKTIWYAGGEIDFLNVLGGHRGLDEVDKGQYDKAEETDYAAGGAIFVKSQVFNKIGLFDGRYFLYYEDSDFCLRAKMSGFKIMYLPKALVFHKNAQSTGVGSDLQDYFITRNRMLFASKFLSFRTRFALLREGIKNILIPTRRRAFFDFLFGKFGKGSYIE